MIALTDHRRSSLPSFPFSALANKASMSFKLSLAAHSLRRQQGQLAVTSHSSQTVASHNILHIFAIDLVHQFPEKLGYFGYGLLVLSTSSSRFHQQPVHPGVTPPRLRSKRCYSSKRLFPWLASAIGNALQKILEPGLIGLKTMLQFSMSWMENWRNHNTSIKYEATSSKHGKHTLCFMKPSKWFEGRKHVSVCVIHTL